jgi:hypothetical protein
MRQHSDTVPVMIRPRWTGTDEQEQVLAEAVQEFQAARDHEQGGWSKAQQARALGVPDTVICQRADISRATLQRKLGHRPDAGE